MRKRDWLLIALGDRLEPIQVQKTLFKFAEESGAPEAERYEFVPYNWGPCSFAIYGDLGELREEGLVEFEASGRGWNVYRVTGEGARAAKELREKADSDLVKRMDDIREYVTSRSFGRLLRDVYADYPESAERSLFEK
ncbi:MAG: hypothetical protein IH864_07220 [Chloroflexi bacterium]|nr:hypothetical protein [Chloroflexota bacterium]